MTVLGKFKLFVVAFTIFYSVYLTTYKCPKVQESVLDHTVQKLVHPFSHQHDKLCEGIQSTQEFIHPYYSKVQGFLDSHVHSHVHSHHLYKEYKVESKFAAAKAHYYDHVHAFVLKFWSWVELAEYHFAVQSNKAYKFLESHFHKTVVPKVAELKSTVAAHAETVAEQVKSKVQ